LGQPIEKPIDPVQQAVFQAVKKTHCKKASRFYLRVSERMRATGRGR
jgi:hypothetical protein